MTSSNMTTTRRDFLQLAGAMAAAATPIARAQTAPDYKALVCVFLLGGNDGHNMVVPMASAAYNAYRAIRGPLALPDGSATLLQVNTPGGVPYGLSSGLAAIAPLWGQGRLAVMANVGTLVRPVSRAQVLAGSAPLPSNLFSHADQMLQQQAGNAFGGGTGWAGRSADAVQSRNGASRFPPSLSMAGQALFCNGLVVQSASLIPGYDLAADGLRVWPASAEAARRQGLQSVLGFDSGMALVQAANKVRADAITLGGLLAGSAGGAAFATPFPGTPLGQQLQQVAQIIRLRATTGMARQVFFTSIGGFDTHANQGWAHWDLLRNVGEALAAFYAATAEMGVAQQVTSFTQSDFGRTLQPSGNGSDHGWGNHQLVLGGAVRGGDIYGTFPFPALAGADDSGSRGALIPSTSLDQFGATIARWFGVGPTAMSQVFPNLGNFAAADLGFLG